MATSWKAMDTDTLDSRGFGVCECGHLIVSDHTPYRGVCLECAGCNRHQKIEELGLRKRVVQILMDAA